MGLYRYMALLGDCLCPLIMATILAGRLSPVRQAMYDYLAKSNRVVTG